MPLRSEPCRVLLVDRERTLENRVRPLFRHGDLVSCDEGADYESALAIARAQQPDILLVDLADSDAFGAIEAVMAEIPTPILCGKAPGAREVDGFQALGLGALEIFEWPAHESDAFWADLTRKLNLLSQIRVVKHVRGARKHRRDPPRRGKDQAPEPPFPLVAIAASLGGPKALSQLLRMIPKGFPAPICICQHISEGFTHGLAQWLAYETALRVVEAQDGDWLAAGTVFIAPSGAHLLVTDDGRIRLDHGPPVMGFRPSCDLLLSSAAHAFGRRCIGVVLTGMGRDGARGLKEIRARGGRTLVQDEATCVVYGMPAAAVELGAATEILPLDEIAPALIRLVDLC